MASLVAGGLQKDVSTLWCAYCDSRSDTAFVDFLTPLILDVLSTKQESDLLLAKISVKEQNSDPASPVKLLWKMNIEDVIGCWKSEEQKCLQDLFIAHQAAASEIRKKEIQVEMVGIANKKGVDPQSVLHNVIAQFNTLVALFKQEDDDVEKVVARLDEKLTAIKEKIEFQAYVLQKKQNFLTQNEMQRIKLIYEKIYGRKPDEYPQSSFGRSIKRKTKLEQEQDSIEIQALCKENNLRYKILDVDLELEFLNRNPENNLNMIKDLDGSKEGLNKEIDELHVATQCQLKDIRKRIHEENVKKAIEQEELAKKNIEQKRLAQKAEEHAEHQVNQSGCELEMQVLEDLRRRFEEMNFVEKKKKLSPCIIA